MFTPEDLWKRLCEEDRNIFGLICTVERTVRRSTFPQTKRDIVPVDSRGLVRISKYVRDGFIQCAPVSQRMKWHSEAADYWLVNGNMTERFIHLVR